MKFIKAKNFTPAVDRDVSLIIIHSAEDPEKPDTELAVALWFAGVNAPQASAHYVVGAVEVVQCLGEGDVAWGAPHANRQGIHVEHVGYARQTFDEWRDTFSRTELTLSARLSAEIAFRWAIPLVHLSPEQVAAGARGFCGHWDVTRAFNTPGGHVDPGEFFPWDDYMQAVHDAAEELCHDSPT